MLAGDFLKLFPLASNLLSPQVWHPRPTVIGKSIYKFAFGLPSWGWMLPREGVLGINQVCVLVCDTAWQACQVGSRPVQRGKEPPTASQCSTCAQDAALPGQEAAQHDTTPTYALPCRRPSSPPPPRTTRCWSRSSCCWTWVTLLG
jgi:hypothetical protein